MSKKDRYAHLNESFDTSDAVANEEDTSVDSPTETVIRDAELLGDENTPVEQTEPGVSVTVQCGDTEHVVEFAEDTDVTVEQILQHLENTQTLEFESDHAPPVEDTPQSVFKSVVNIQNTVAALPLRMSHTTAKTVVAGTIAAGTLVWVRKHRQTNR